MAYRPTIHFSILESHGLLRPTPSSHQTASCLLELSGVDPIQIAGVKDRENPNCREQLHFENLDLITPSLHAALTITAKCRGQSRIISIHAIEPSTQFERWIPLTAERQPCGQLHVRISLLNLTQRDVEMISKSSHS